MRYFQIVYQFHEKKYNLRFFYISQKGLELNQKFPIGEYLAANDIVPGGEYTGETIVNALKPYLDGKSPGLQCDLLHEISNPVLYQISICFDKEFNIIGCENLVVESMKIVGEFFTFFLKKTSGLK